MMIKFREHRGGLAEAMKTYKEFYTIEDFINYVLKLPYNIQNVSFGPSYGADDRIGWKSTRYVKGHSKEHPHEFVIGMCDFGERG